MILKCTSQFILPLALGAILWGCEKKEASTKEQPAVENQLTFVKLSQSSKTEIGLKTEKMENKLFANVVTLTAKVLANQDNEAWVGSLVEGRVCKVFVKLGDNVKAGQDLMMVEGLEIGQIKAGFLSAKANLAYQKTNFDRQKNLLSENIGSQKSFLESQNEYEKALAEFSAHKTKINAIGLTDSEVIDERNNNPENRNNGTLTVKSPIKGIVVDRNVVIGQLIEGTTNAFKIVDLSSVWIDGQVYEKDIDNISKNSKTCFIASAYPDNPFKGAISYIGQVIDEKTRTLTIRAEFPNVAGKLKPQMFGELQIATQKNDLSISVPAEAIAKIDNADFVFIQKNDSTFEKRAVVTGAAHQEIVEITKGIQAGETIVTKGAFYLKAELLKATLGEE